MGIVTKYVCDKCGQEVDTPKQIANVNFESAFGTVVINKILCKNCWKDFIKTVRRYFEENESI